MEKINTIEDLKKKCSKDYKTVVDFLETKKFFVNNPLDFTNVDNNYGGWYSHESKTITVNLYHMTMISNMVSLFAHEKAHVICKEYGIDREKGKPHHLEFAIIYYAIKYKVETLNYKSALKTFLCSYDIQDDLAYKKFTINLARFDERIKNIEFNTIDDLVKFSIEYAENVREKCKSPRIRDYMLEHPIFKKKAKIEEYEEDEKFLYEPQEEVKTKKLKIR